MFESFMTTDIVLRGFFVGFLLAVFCVAYNKLVIGKFVKALINSGAVHPAFAKTFEQLNLKKNFWLLYALRAKGSLRKLVFELDYDGKKGYYYIPEDKLYRVGRLYGGKDVDVLMVAALVLTLFIFFAIVLMVVPVINDQFSNLFSSV
ncbi:MAG: hypothetical protein FWG34_07670 [Oscillospiraceae bacterium]|jgi:hypothetical protein|nr:hypothetical protein [Oscillospiraceae bacterium]